MRFHIKHQVNHSSLGDDQLDHETISCSPGNKHLMNFGVERQKLFLLIVIHNPFLNCLFATNKMISFQSFYSYPKRIGPWLFTAYLLVTLLLYHYELDNAVKLIFSPSSITIARADIEPDLDGLTPLNNSDLACQIPQLDPYHREAKSHMAGFGKIPGCGYPKLFNSTFDRRIIPVMTKEVMSAMGIRSCCYKNFSRFDDYKNNYDDLCHPLSLTNETLIPPAHQFISINCEGKESKVYDLHSFINSKEVEKVEEEGKVNVIILGLDSVSRMQFIRSMPKSRAYLMNELKAVEMTGFNKVGDNTFPNLMPLLTSLSGRETEWECMDDHTFDECPFIWKLFKEKGYRISLAEDESGIGILNSHSHRGFKLKPADYYFRAFAVEARKTIKTGEMCYGPRLSFEVLLDNMKKFLFEMKRIGKPYFQFTWSTALTHTWITGANLGEPHLLEMLKWMKNSSYLNNTLLILMSDHGSRYEGFRNSIQGQLEDRLPVLYLVLPDWMKRGEYDRAYKNLLGNRERLVTTYDLHQVLLDVLNPEGMKNGSIERRERELSERDIPRGISLFLPIPKERTCDMAEIDPNYCSCRFFRQLKINESAAYKAALIGIDKINYILNKTANCSSLSLSSVIMAQYGVQKDWEWIQVNFQTVPGNATFEAIVMIERKWLGRGDDWKVSGTISRTNVYGNQSHCVNENSLKPYCYCV